jgi:hypothetical protein
MKVICPKCRATTNLGPNGGDLSDYHYKLECPVLRERRDVTDRADGGTSVERGETGDVNNASASLCRHVALWKSLVTVISKRNGLDWPLGNEQCCGGGQGAADGKVVGDGSSAPGREVRSAKSSYRLRLIMIVQRLMAPSGLYLKESAILGSYLTSDSRPARVSA